jgi:peptidoglycan/xylan/chitin deacetylase (PgdA/CDA1 family)
VPRFARSFRVGLVVVVAGLLLVLLFATEALLYEVGVCTTVPEAGSAIALTFDDGPSAEYTPAVLDILAVHGARATFFVVGTRAEAHPELIERIVAEGHEVAHHTHTHRVVSSLTIDELREEFELASALFAGYGIEPAWYRPPRGELCVEQKRLAREHGMKVALWTRAMERARFSSAEQMAETLIAEMRPGDIVLAHDGGLDRSATVEALPMLLEGLAERGLAVVTLTELHELAEE